MCWVREKETAVWRCTNVKAVTVADWEKSERQTRKAILPNGRQSKPPCVEDEDLLVMIMIVSGVMDSRFPGMSRTWVTLVIALSNVLQQRR
jgi:hypothetical protein